MPLQIRRGTNAERQNMIVPLAPGEPLYTTDQGFLYIGDGNTIGGVQVTGYQDEDAVDAVAAALVAGQNQNITFIYGSVQDFGDRIDAVLDLSTYIGEISADSFRGTILADDSTIIINSSDSSINLDGTVKGDIIPDQSESYDIGSAVRKFKDLYLSGSSLWLGDAQLTAIGAAINLPAGSTIGGQPLGISGGDLNINIVGDDSSTIVDISNNVVTATGGFVGDLTGNVIGNVIGNVVGDLSGNVTGSVYSLDGSSFLLNAVDNSINATGGIFGDLTGSIRNIANQVVLNPETKTATFNEINLESQSLINGNPVFFGLNSVFVTTADGSTGPIPTISANAFTDNPAFGPTVAVGKSRGNVLSQTILQNNDRIGQFLFMGFNGTEFFPGLGLRAYVDGTPPGGAGSFIPGRLEIDIANAANTEITTAIFYTTKIDFRVPPKLPIVADDTARTVLIPTAEQGMMIFMQSGTTPAATNQVQVFDGSNWVNMS